MENQILEENQIRDLAQGAKDGKITIEILEGQSKKLLDPVEPIEKMQLLAYGNIDTPFEFLKKRAELFKRDECNISVNYDKREITFNGNDQRFDEDFDTIVGGKIVTSLELQKLPLNKNFNPKILARELRKIRYLFHDKQEFLRTFSELSSFEAKVAKEIKDSDDRTGNAEKRIKQEVSHNLTTFFSLNMPLIKGGEKTVVKIEMDIEPETLECSLICPEMDSFVVQQSKQMIDNELDKFIPGIGKTEKDQVLLKDFCFIYYK